MKAVIFAFAALCFSEAHATVTVTSPMNVTTEVPSWINTYTATVQGLTAKGSYPAQGYTECRATLEVPGAYLCLSNTQTEMNSALGRASMFIEGLGDPTAKGVILKQNNPNYLYYKSMIGGHDLRGADLLRFYGTLMAACTSTKDPEVCPSPHEKELFESFIVPRASNDPSFVVISFANQSLMAWNEVVTHEIMHAQYFNDPRFRQVTDDFWNNEMTETERAAVRSRLGRNYDANDELLMRNEFQAYILMAGAEVNMLYDFVSKYRARLIKKLSEADVTPVQVH